MAGELNTVDAHAGDVHIRNTVAMRSFVEWKT